MGSIFFFMSMSLSSIRFYLILRRKSFFCSVIISIENNQIMLNNHTKYVKYHQTLSIYQSITYRCSHLSRPHCWAQGPHQDQVDLWVRCSVQTLCQTSCLCSGYPFSFIWHDGLPVMWPIKPSGPYWCMRFTSLQADHHSSSLSAWKLSDQHTKTKWSYCHPLGTHIACAGSQCRAV